MRNFSPLVISLFVFLLLCAQMNYSFGGRQLLKLSKFKTFDIRQLKGVEGRAPSPFTVRGIPRALARGPSYSKLWDCISWTQEWIGGPPYFLVHPNVFFTTLLFGTSNHFFRNNFHLVRAKKKNTFQTNLFRIKFALLNKRTIVYLA